MANAFVSYATGPALRPGEPGAVIRLRRGGGVELVNLIWGFAPAEPGGRPFTYVRAEGRSFDRQGSEGGRCLIPASEFTVASGRGASRRKWRATLAVTNGLFYFAAVWRPATRDWPPSYALITIPAGPDIAPIQARQAAVIRRADRMGWLEQREPEAKLLAALPRASFWLEQVEGPPVSRRQLAKGEDPWRGNAIPMEGATACAACNPRVCERPDRGFC